MSHDLLSLMMERNGLSGSFLATVRDIYSNASIAIRTGRDSYTPPIFQKRGVKQGCPLSPILFNIVLEGLLRHLSSCDAGYTLAGGKVNSLTYADDICVQLLAKRKSRPSWTDAYSTLSGQDSYSRRNSVAHYIW